MSCFRNLVTHVVVRRPYKHACADTLSNMSFGYPALRPHPSEGQTITPKEGPYGVPDLMYQGFSSVKNDLSSRHPLEYSEQQWTAHQDKMNMTMLKNMQGSHAPLRLHMERNIAKRMERLPGLPSSHVMLDTLTGGDETIDFSDYLNSPEESEVMGQPHAIYEKRQGLL